MPPKPLHEKRSGYVTFRCPTDLVVWLTGYAAEQGLSTSEFVLRLVLHEHRQETKNGKPGTARQPIMADMTEAYEQAKKAVADGMIDNVERQRITRPLSRFLALIWNPKGGAR